MDKNLALSTSYDSSTNLPLTFGPEWLNKEHSFPQAESSHDEGGRHVSPKGRPPLMGKNRLPLKFTRSKSSPLLLQPPKPPEEILKEKASAATSPETNQPGNFDKNFPTLSTKAPPAKATTVSAWKQPPIDVITNPKSKEASKQNGHSSEDKSDDLEHLKGLVPSTAPPPPKVLRNNHAPKKPSPKVNSPSGPKPIVPKPPFNKSMFRKASSEPTLPLNPTYQEKYAKLLAQGSKNSSASSSGSNTPERKDAGSDAEKNSKTFDSRTDFFLGLLKEEQRKMKQQTDPNEKDHSSENGETKVKPPALNMEDEERFLRDLGWVPEEEAHVPELTEQEILEVRAKIVPHKERPTVTFNLQKKFTSVSIDPEFS